MDILNSITPAKLKEGSHELTDKLTNVYYHATPKSGSDSQYKNIFHHPLSRSFDDDKKTSDSKYFNDMKRINSDALWSSTSRLRQEHYLPVEVKDRLKDFRKEDSSFTLSQQQQQQMFKDHFRDRKQDSSILPSSSKIPMKYIESFMQPSLGEDTISSSSKLDQKQIKELLALTKIAELTAIKKEGVSYPGSAFSLPSITPLISRNEKTSSRGSKKTKAEKQHSYVKKLLLKKPRIAGLLNFLIRSKKSKDLLKFLRSSYDEAMERTMDVEKRHELTDKYNKALHRLLQLWNKRLSQPDGGGREDEDENYSRTKEEKNEK